MDPVSVVSSLVGVLSTTRKIQSILARRSRNKKLPSRGVFKLENSISDLNRASELLVRLLQDNPGVVPNPHATGQMLYEANLAMGAVERQLLEIADAPFIQRQSILEDAVFSLETFTFAMNLTIQAIQIQVNVAVEQRDSVSLVASSHLRAPSTANWDDEPLHLPVSLPASFLEQPFVRRIRSDGRIVLEPETREPSEFPEPTTFAEWLMKLKPKHVRILEKISFIETKNKEMIIPETQVPPQSLEAERAVELSSDGANATRIEQMVAGTGLTNSESEDRDKRLNNINISPSASAQNNTMTPTEYISRNEASHGDKRINVEEQITEVQPRLLLRLLICDSDFKGTHLNTLSFTKEKFVSYMEETQLPVDLVQFMFTGTALFLRTADDAGQRSSFVLRMPLAKSENWTMGMSFNVKTGVTSAMIHGLQKDEFESFMAELRSIKSTSVHPFHLAATLCELLTEADSNGVKQLAAGLFQIENKTIWHGYWQPGKASELFEDRTPEHDFEYLTRSLNHIHSRLAFFEMRINANTTLVSKIRSFLTNQDEEWASIIPKNEYDKLVIALDQRLESLQAEHNAILAEVACNQKIANGQLQIVYNLIAQHDNKENLRMAELSTQIAAITKDDSFAMRTIAVMTIAFLPATAISSLFSMGMFNWQAEPVLRWFRTVSGSTGSLRCHSR